MKIFDFVVKNADTISSLDVSEDGIILLSCDDFDFSYQNLSVEVDDEFGLVFKADVAPFVLSTSVASYELKDVVHHLAGITDPDIRKTVLEEIDKTFREEADTEVEVAKEVLEDAKKQLQEANDVLNEVSQSVRKLKSAWSIP